VYYQGYPSIKIGNVKNAEDVKEVCPRKVFELDGKKLKIKNNEACILCNACVDASANEVEVKSSDKDFIVTIEPWGQLTPLEIVEGVVDVLHEQVDELSEEIKKLK
jgi:NAD-dependent dihydropyrimidine dehydrogenase PreA subunit